MLWTALLLGFAGSLHCAGMCGPLALALPVTGSGTVGLIPGRLAYQAGRIATYSLLGLLFGWLGRSLAMVGVQRWVSLAAGLLILAGLGVSGRPWMGTAMTRAVAGLKSAWGALLRRRTVAALGILGLLNGLLPCGLVYTACAGATVAGGVLEGVAYMALFGVGTLPMMLGISLSGRALPTAWRFRLQRWVPVSVAVVGVLLILRGLALGIPYLSPDLAAGSCEHCH